MNWLYRVTFDNELIELCFTAIFEREPTRKEEEMLVRSISARHHLGLIDWCRLGILYHLSSCRSRTFTHLTSWTRVFIVHIGANFARIGFVRLFCLLDEIVCKEITVYCSSIHFLFLFLHFLIWSFEEAIWTQVIVAHFFTRKIASRLLKIHSHATDVTLYSATITLIDVTFWVLSSFYFSKLNQPEIVTFLATHLMTLIE